MIKESIAFVDVEKTLSLKSFGFPGTGGRNYSSRMDIKVNKLSTDNLKNIQKFLSIYKKSSHSFGSHFSVEFTRNSKIYSEEPLLPDMWIKTRSPFDKNQVFYEDSLKYLRKKWGSQKAYRKINYYGRTPNYFP
jgi:hypothetical protein